MKKRILILLTLCCITVLPGIGQELIGQPSDSVRSLVRKFFPGFLEDVTSKNDVFNYLKFEDQEGLQTLLVFMSDNDTCKYYKRICDYDLLEIITKSFDNKYQKVDSLWYYFMGNRAFRKELKKEDWFFSITTRPDNNRESPLKGTKKNFVLNSGDDIR